MPTAIDRWIGIRRLTLDAPSIIRPSHPPDLKPIEQGFANIKAPLRKAELAAARSYATQKAASFKT